MAIPHAEHGRIQNKLGLIAKFLAFEIAFGKNGVVWIDQTGSNTSHILMVSNCIKAVRENLPDEVIETICKVRK